MASRDASAERRTHHEGLLQQMRQLNEDGAYRSAAIIGNMLLACSSSPTSGVHNGVVLACSADALMGLEEWRRAVSHYERAIETSQQRRGSRGGTGGRGRSSSATDRDGASAADVATWHLKGARCLSKLGNQREAINLVRARMRGTGRGGVAGKGRWVVVGERVLLANVAPSCVCVCVYSESCSLVPDVRHLYHCASMVQR